MLKNTQDVIDSYNRKVFKVPNVIVDVPQEWEGGSE